MSRRERSTQTASLNPPRRVRRLMIPGVVIVSVVALLLFGRGILALWGRRMAAGQMNVGAISVAQQWLAWSAWLDPDDGKTELMQAACFRRLYRQELWSKALQSAERKGAPAARVRQEMDLGLIQAGRHHEMEKGLGALIDEGVSPHDVSAAFVHGYLAGGDPRSAEMVLHAWAADHPGEARVAYMRGVYRQWLGDGAGDLARRRACFDRAQTEYEKALARQPSHELARTALAELFEEQDRLEEALKQYVELATRSPASEAGKSGLARLLRQLGSIDKARAALKSLISHSEVPSSVAVEMGQIELESGHYEEAERWLRQAGLDDAEDNEMLRAAATTLALRENTTGAERLLARMDAAHSRSVRIDDLLARLATGSHDKEAADELQRLSPPSTATSIDVVGSPREPAGADRRETSGTSVSDLYALYCSACHGASGDGNGRATRHLFPRPRDLRTGKSRLASTMNGVPTLEDLELVIRRGMPGTSMRPFDNLSEDQRKLLAQEVLRLNREGIREQFINVLRDEGEKIDEDEVREVVELCTTPGEPVAVPRIGPAVGHAIARGKDSYFKLGCDNCHGDDGAGAPDTPLFDDKGRPAPIRDLVREPFKGGHEPESIYLRIFVGMPGTPHPACWNVPEEKLVDLVHFCRWLSREPKRMLTEHQRAVQATSGVNRSAMGGW